MVIWILLFAFSEGAVLRFHCLLRGCCYFGFGFGLPTVKETEVCKVEPHERRPVRDVGTAQ